MINADARALMAKVNKEYQKKYGTNAIIMASEVETTFRFPTGSLAFDVALGGGWPGNKWAEIYGKESHGKTFVTLKTIAANQQRDPDFTTLWVAAEHYDRDQAEALGVDSERVLVLSTQEMEYAYQQIIDFAQSKTVDCIVLDSYPALSPNEELEKDMDEYTMATGAKLTNKFFRKVLAFSNRNLEAGERPFLGIFINQQRDDIGGFSPRGPAQITPGGKGKNYAFYTRVIVKRGDYITEKRSGEGEIKVGQEIKINTFKAKSAPPLQVATMDAYFRDAPTLGFTRGEYDVTGEIITMGILFGVIKRNGAWFNYGEQKWNGRLPLIQAVREDLDLSEALTREVMDSWSTSESLDENDLAEAETAGERKVKLKNG